ncbi:MAG: hypothetical protein PWP04_687, partial [Candidatus Atribacteria bacterium]|nr:hypothetical protein [Candidatus Atribacteria bacterium]
SVAFVFFFVFSLSGGYKGGGAPIIVLLKDLTPGTYIALARKKGVYKGEFFPLIVGRRFSFPYYNGFLRLTSI